MAKARVLCIYGSESGNSERGIRRWVKKWLARENLQFEVCDVITGNNVEKTLGGDGQASAKNLEFLSSKFHYDVLLVCTSSYGSGDPPSNMGDFFRLLSHQASMRSDALVGMQHAVLGFGSSTYPTFQNVPRLTDRYLGECGSRRLAQRAEIDEHDDNPGEEKEYFRWGEDVFKALQALPKADAPPACDWTSPASKVSENDEDAETPKAGLWYYASYVAITAAVVAYIYTHPNSPEA